MAEQSAQQEPSMEEILASIRRIISEDGEEEAAGEGAEAASGPVAVEDAEPEPAPEPEADPEPVAQVVEDPAADAEEPAAAAEDDFEAAAAEPEPEPEPEPISTPEMAMEDDGDDVLELTDVVSEAPAGETIVSHITEAATSEHLNALSSLVVRNYAGAENTLEGLVREMLKPMLREWLDANLPTLVEQMVNREIARIAGREK